MNRMHWVVLIASTAFTVSCGRDENVRTPIGSTNTAQEISAADSAGPAAAADSAVAAHGTHDATEATSAQDPTHAGHAAGTPARRDTSHASHRAPSLAHREASHETPRDASHTTHRDTSHTAHRDTAHTAHRDTSHTAHRDTSHTAHRDTSHTAHRDTSHTAHAAPAPDPAHAGHAPQSAQQATENHSQHRGTPQEKLHQGHGRMAMLNFGGGWMALGMAQVFPTVTVAIPSEEATPLERTGVYLTQPALMFNVESPGSFVTLRTTINLEGLTQPDGELTFGGWGEGFLDKRHPHTYLHELMLSLNLRRGDARGLSISAGKGFAPYGTDDPMMRPVVKYPTNHHLSQILERWTVNGIWADPNWSVEAGVFGGAEPTSAGDLSNIESFADSWSVRVTRRVGAGIMGAWPWEIAASFGRVVEEHHEEVTATKLYNVAVRHEGDHGNVHLYTLVEASRSDPQSGDGHYSVVGEFSAQTGRHKPYGRIEYATRPEWSREGPRDSDEFFRYDHDAHSIGSTKWLIATAGYGGTVTTLPFSIRPYIEAQYNRASAHKGGVDPVALFGRKSFWSLSAGMRIFLGGDPMRMGSYGILDPMTTMHLMQMSAATAADTSHQH